MSDFVLQGREFGVERSGMNVTLSDIDAFEAQIQTPLPTQLKDFYLRWNGGLPYPVEVPEDKSVWVRLHWNETTEAAHYGPAAPLESMFRINSDPPTDFLRTWSDYKDRIPRDTLCFAGDPGGSLFLIGTGDHNLGRIYFWARSSEADRGSGELPDYKNIAYVADSFDDFLLALREEPNPGEPLNHWVGRVYKQ